MFDDDMKEEVVGEEDFSTSFSKKGADEDTVIGAIPEEDGDDEDKSGRWGNDDMEEEMGE